MKSLSMKTNHNKTETGWQYTNHKRKDGSVEIVDSKGKITLGKQRGSHLVIKMLLVGDPNDSKK